MHTVAPCMLSRFLFLSSLSEEKRRARDEMHGEIIVSIIAFVLPVSQLTSLLLNVHKLNEFYSD